MTDENLGQKIADAVEQVLHPTAPTIVPPSLPADSVTIPSIATHRDPITGTFYWPTPKAKQ